MFWLTVGATHQCTQQCNVKLNIINQRNLRVYEIDASAETETLIEIQVRDQQRTVGNLTVICLQTSKLIN